MSTQTDGSARWVARLRRSLALGVVPALSIGLSWAMVGPAAAGQSVAAGLAAGQAVQSSEALPPVAGRDLATVNSGSTALIEVLGNDTGESLQVMQAYLADATAGSARALRNKVEYKVAAGFVGEVLIVYSIKDANGLLANGELVVTVTPAPVETTPPTPSPTPSEPRPSPKPTKTPSPKPTPTSAKPTPAPPTPTTAPPAGPLTKKRVEQALVALGLPAGSANGKYDAKTRRALCAWRTVSGRPANRSLPSSAEARAIVATTALPAARSSMVTGLNVSKTCQVAFWVSSADRYRAIMPATTGKPGYVTRSGVHRVFVSWRVWRYSTIYPEARMYKPMQFSGGQAVHGSATDRLIKTYPASHGCVRMLHKDIDALQAAGFGLGSLVRVFGKW